MENVTEKRFQPTAVIYHGDWDIIRQDPKEFERMKGTMRGMKEVVLALSGSVIAELFARINRRVSALALEDDILI